MRLLYEGIEEYGKLSKHYNSIIKDFLNQSDELTTKVELYFFKLLADSCLSSDPTNLEVGLDLLKELKDANSQGEVFFNNRSGNWWPSVGEHYWCVDYIAGEESFTQLTYTLLLSIFDEKQAIENFERLKNNSLFFDQESGFWIDKNLINEPCYGDKIFKARDQLMAIAVESHLDFDSAKATYVSLPKILDTRLSHII